MLKMRQVAWSRDDKNLSDTRQHECAERVIDHRLVINRQQTLANRVSDGIKPGARSTRQNDAPIGRCLIHVMHCSEYTILIRLGIADGDIPPLSLNKDRRNPVCRLSVPQRWNRALLGLPGQNLSQFRSELPAVVPDENIA